MALTATLVNDLETAAGKEALRLSKQRVAGSVLKKIGKFTITDVLLGAAGGAIGGGLGSISAIEKLTKPALNTAAATFVSDRTYGWALGKVTEGGLDKAAGLRKGKREAAINTLRQDAKTAADQIPKSTPANPPLPTGVQIANFYGQERHLNSKHAKIEAESSSLSTEVGHQIDQLNRAIKAYDASLVSCNGQSPCHNLVKATNAMYYTYRKSIKTHHYVDKLEDEYNLTESAFNSMQDQLSSCYDALHALIKKHGTDLGNKPNTNVKVTGTSKWNKPKSK